MFLNIFLTGGLNITLKDNFKVDGQVMPVNEAYNYFNNLLGTENDNKVIKIEKVISSSIQEKVERYIILKAMVCYVQTTDSSKI